jgi:cytochrome b
MGEDTVLAPCYKATPKGMANMTRWVSRGLGLRDDGGEQGHGRLSMERVLVWDLPTRVFHWLFTAAVAGAFILVGIDEENGRVFQGHMLFGLMAGFLVLLRLVWGVIGSRYARFGSFLFGPKALLEYLRSVARGTGVRHVGHSPGSAYAVYAMLLAGMGLAVSGMLMPSWEGFEAMHAMMASLMLVAVGAHLTGLVLHTIRYRENIAFSMIHGGKEGQPDQGIAAGHALLAVLFLGFAGAWGSALVAGHDAQTRRLTLLGRTLTLPQPQDEEAQEHEGARGQEGRDHGKHHRDHAESQAQEAEEHEGARGQEGRDHGKHHRDHDEH